MADFGLPPQTWIGLLPKAQSPEEQANAMLLFQKAQQGQQQTSGQNALAKLFGSPGNVDASGAGLRPDAMRSLMATAPATGLDFAKSQAEIGQRQAASRRVEQQVTAEQLVEIADEFKPLGLKREELIKSGLTPDAADNQMQQDYTAVRDNLAKSGRYSPTLINQRVPPNWDYNRWLTTQQSLKDYRQQQQQQQQQDERQGWKTQEDVTPSGQTVQYRYNPGTGQATDLAGNPYKPTGIAAPKGAEAQLYSGEVKDDKGAKRTVTARMGPSGGWVDTETNEPIKGLTGIRKVGTAGTVEPDDSQVAKTAQAIAGYQQAPLSGYALRAPGAQAVMAKVLELNPDYQATRYPEVAKAMRDFGTGPQGNTTRSLNVAVDHLGSLGELATALNNSDVSVINRVGNLLKTELGLSSAPNTFEAARSIVGSEVTKAVVGGVSALGDREEARKPIDAARSPQQLADVIAEYKRLMAGQLTGLERQYEDATGFGPDSQFAFKKKLDPRTQEELARARTPNAPGEAASGPVKMSGDKAADRRKWEAAPPKTRFVFPDGSEAVK